MTQGNDNESSGDAYFGNRMNLLNWNEVRRRRGRRFLRAAQLAVSVLALDVPGCLQYGPALATNCSAHRETGRPKRLIARATLVNRSSKQTNEITVMLRTGPGSGGWGPLYHFFAHVGPGEIWSGSSQALLLSSETDPLSIDYYLGEASECYVASVRYSDGSEYIAPSRM